MSNAAYQKQIAPYLGLGVGTSGSGDMQCGSASFSADGSKLYIAGLQLDPKLTGPQCIYGLLYKSIGKPVEFGVGLVQSEQNTVRFYNFSSSGNCRMGPGYHTCVVTLSGRYNASAPYGGSPGWFHNSNMVISPG